MSPASIDLRSYGDELLTNLLDFAMHSTQGAIGAGVNIAVDLSNDNSCIVAKSTNEAPESPPGTPRSVAAVGVAAVLDPEQWTQATGPLWEAFRTGTLVQIPVLTETGSNAGPDIEFGLPDDEFGPVGDAGPSDFGLSCLSGVDAGLLGGVHGAVFSAGEWGGELPILLSVYLDRPADAKTLRDIDRYEPVITQALSVVEYCAGEEQVAQQMLQMTQYRRVIEQAKGLVMGAAGGDATAAFATLARASQHFNVRLRHLAVALVEYVGNGAAEHPDDPELAITPSQAERQVAARVWAALTTAKILAPPRS